MNQTRPVRRATLRFVVMLVIGITTAVLTAVFGSPLAAPTAGWAAAAGAYTIFVLSRTLPMDEAQTRRHASTEDPSRPVTELLILIANAAGVVAVVLLIILSHQQGDSTRMMGAALAFVTVVCSWALIHTLFTLRYAELYYTAEPVHGVDFNQKEPARYTDFYYLATSIGMTYQVSDTNLKTTQIRKEALKHALLSYLYGTLVLASTINMVISLAA